MLPDIATLHNNFSLLESWEDRYAYVLDLAKKIPVMDDAFKTEENFVRGCTAQVWLVPMAAEQGRVAFQADSDAHLVRGLIAILMAVYNNQTTEHVRSFDIENYFNSLGLAEHLTPNRRNGFFAMVQRIKALAV